MNRGARHVLAAGLAAICFVWRLGLPVRAAPLLNPPPFHFRDDYTTDAHVNLGVSTAALDTAAGGTVMLPYAPVEASFDPAGTYALVATQEGVFAYVADGDGIVAATGWRLKQVSARGATWIMGGRAFAVATGGTVAIYGLSAGPAGYEARVVARGSLPGALGVAAGPQARVPVVLVATTSGATLLQVARGRLRAVPGGPGGLTANAGVATTTDGTVAATWRAGAVEIWVWDGSAYLTAPSWAPPAPPAPDGPVVGVAFFPQGSGYWVLTRQGQLLAYAYGVTGLRQVAAASLSVPATPVPPAGVAAGWAGSGVAVLYPDGWRYFDVAQGVMRVDLARGLAGQHWPLYTGSAVLQSTPIPVGHSVTRLRVEDADCAAGNRPPRCTNEPILPSGTRVTYQVSTDGCQAWRDAQPFTNVRLPAGTVLCYRLLLWTADRAVTPIVGVTNLYEIRRESKAGPLPALLCLGASC